jgi:hypothetical protein
MQFTEEKIHTLKKKYAHLLEALEMYDETREWPIGKDRVDITLSRKIIRKLKEMKEKTGKSVSQIIEEAVLKSL